MKIYLYSRISTDKQTLEQQERTALEWLTSHKLAVDEVVSDEGVSGGVGYSDRNLGKVLIPKMKSGDLLIVSEISRLGRSMFDLSKLINTELKQRGIRLVIVSMGIDLRCDKLTAIDELILNNFAFAAQLEKQLIKERTTSALRVKKQQGIKFGRANDSYNVDENKQNSGRRKAAITRTSKTINSNEFQSFCRILKRTFSILQAPNDLLQAPNDLFMLSWHGIKNELLRMVTKKELKQIEKQMKIAREDNQELFKSYPLDSSKRQLDIIRAKICNTLNTIDTYVINNK